MTKKTQKTSFITPQQLTVTDGTKAYIELRKKVIGHGILNRAYGYYIFISVVTFTGLLFSAYKIFITPISLELIIWCLVMAFFIVQIGGLVHDAGHRTIAKSTKINDILGHMYGSFITLGYSYWR